MTDADAPLKRLGGGRWATRDERFTIEPQSGTWVVLDAEQADELGLPLVRGPFASLTAAKSAIAAARAAPPVASPLQDRAAAIRRRADDAPDERASPGRRTKARPAEPARSVSRRTAAPAARPPATPAEPAWIASLGPADRRRARQLIERLTAAGARDPAGIVKRDLVGDVPAVAAFALARAIENLGARPAPDTIVRLLTGGGDEQLSVRWRLVDGQGRPISLDPGPAAASD